MPLLPEPFRAVEVLARSGLLAPVRPDRMLRAADALRHYGLGLGSAVAAAAARHPDRTAVIDPRGALTFAEVDGRTNAMARGLQRLGIDAGTTVGILCRNHRGFLEASGAAAKLGAHIVFLNTSFARPQLLEVAQREVLDLIAADAALVRLTKGFTGDVVLVDEPAGEGGGPPSLEDFARDEEPGRPSAPGSAGRTVILTSGTTGTPKGAHRATPRSAGAALDFLEALPYRSGDVIVVAAPLFHAWGFGAVTIALVLGATVVLQPQFDAEATLAAAARHRATALVAVPVMLRRILDLPPATRARYDTSALRLVPLSGSAIPAGVAERFMDEFGEVVFNLYGSTEVGYATVASPDDLRAAPGTAGRPLRRAAVRILDAADRPVPVGEIGRIFVRSGVAFDGYTGGGGKEVVDGAMETGDTGYFDTHGRLFVVGRDDDMIVSGGENVFPLEIERVLEAHPDVVEAAVIGVPDEEFGQRLKAFVVRRPGADLDAGAVRSAVRERLARFKVPRDVEFVDTLPRNPTGKLLRRALT